MNETQAQTPREIGAIEQITNSAHANSQRLRESIQVLRKEIDRIAGPLLHDAQAQELGKEEEANPSNLLQLERAIGRQQDMLEALDREIARLRKV